MVLHHVACFAARHIAPHIVHHFLARFLAAKGTSMLKKIGFYLLGNFVTPDAVKYLLDEALRYLKDAAKKTATDIDDQGLAFIEKEFDNDETAKKLADFLMTALKAGK